MPNRTAVIVTPLLLAAAIGGLGAADASGSQPAKLKATVIKLKYTTAKLVKFDKSHYVTYGGLTRRHPIGKGGAATYSCVAAGKTTSSCHAAFTLKRGIILATVTVDFSQGAVTGDVTGGTGFYRGASGHVTGQPGTGGAENLKVALTS